MDVIALAQFGIHYAVATLGTSVGKPHLEMLFRRVDQVVFCFDGDDAGRKAAFRGMEAALPMMEDGRQVKFLFLPEGEDPDSVVRNKGSLHLEHLFDNADPLETFLFDQMAQGIDLETMDGKARLSKLVAPYINLIPDGVFKTLLFKSLATRTDMDVESLRRLREIEKPVTADYDSASGPEPGEMQREADAPFDYPEGYEPLPDSEDHYRAPAHTEPHSAVLLRALGLLVLKPSSASAVTDELLPEQGGMLSSLLHDLVKQVRETPDLSTAGLLGYWMGTDEGELLSQAAAKEVINEEQHISEHLMAILNKLSRDRHVTLLRKRAETLKSVAYTDLSNEQKRELVALTTEIRQLSGRN
jgi:DNA primase